MFRSNWDLVSPFSWLDSLADEEEFMGRGFRERYPSTHLFIFLRPQTARREQRRREDEPMSGTAEQEVQEEEEEEEEMETEDSPTDEERKLMTSNFFDDLPVGAKLMDTQMPPSVSPPEAKTKDGYSFSTYAYSTCLTADDNGRRVNSTRRRYEDSAGRLKAQHKRQIGTCALESTWKRASEQDEGSHEHKVSSGSVEVFEQAWQRTPFGAAEEQAKAHGAKLQSVLPDQPPAQELP
ncbi:hypothetical protein PHYPSEUDO_001255 [Phytophthora pseudosyringae]|uniref:Uncharacterized protein n=1 Tax=Phytophthora pseudosyringae TaxID=221518 RepID=A0A8T1W0B6_9STRA|nr:hypothetical protein PHYPSEUDO_001255 [Phytophthora pseudosyringae]